MSIFLIYAGVFFAALIFGDLLLRTFINRRQKASFVNHRMKLLDEGSNASDVYQDLIKEREKVGFKFIPRLHTSIQQSGIKITTTRAIFYLVGLSVIISGILAIYELNAILTLVISFFIAAASLYFFVTSSRRRRIKKFIEQLPDALDIVTRSIAAGHPVQAALALVSREMSDPLGTEFGIMVDEITYGSDIDEACREMSERVGADDLNFLTITFSVHKRSGGNLTEIIQNLSDMLRARSKLAAKIKAISAEGVWTGRFMAAYPFFLYFLIITLSPAYYDQLWESGFGEEAVIAGCVLLVLGLIVIRKLVNFDY